MQKFPSFCFAVLVDRHQAGFGDGSEAGSHRGDIAVGLNNGDGDAVPIGGDEVGLEEVMEEGKMQVLERQTLGTQSSAWGISGPPSSVERPALDEGSLLGRSWSNASSSARL